MRTVRITAVTALIGALVVVAAFALPPNASQTTSAGPPKPRIAVMVLENRSYGQVIGNPSAPYLNRLARQGALATRYYAVTHPSLPNYMAITTGGYAEVTGNCVRCATGARSLIDQMNTARVSWRAYFESIPRHVTSPFSPSSPYNRHYNPFVYMETLTKKDLHHIKNFQSLRRDMRAKTLPAFTWIAPNVFHDGHGVKLAVVDRFVSRLVPRVVKALGPHGVLLILWDEGQKTDHTGASARKGGGHVALMAVGPGAARSARITTPATHYALLRTIENRLGLPPLGHAATAQQLSGLFAN
jgi:hypothetical protein